MKVDRMLDEADEKRNGSAFATFCELRSICALVLYASEVEDFDSLDAAQDEALRAHIQLRETIADERNRAPKRRDGPHMRTYIGTPTNSALVAAVVQKALPIVAGTSSIQVKESVQVIADRVRTRKYRWQAADYFRLSGRLRAAFEECLARPAYFDRQFGSRSSRLAAADALCFQAQNVPQLFPELDYHSRFRQFFPNAPEPLARRFCSMAAVKLLGFTWARAATAMELPPEAESQANYVIVRLRRDGNLDKFADELLSWATRLSRSCVRIDYQLRRDTLRSAVDFPPAEWAVLCQRGGIAPGRPGGRSRYAAAWMWADATSGDWRLAPAFKGMSYISLRSAYKVMMKVLLPAMETVLRAEAKRRLERHLDRSNTQHPT